MNLLNSKQVASKLCCSTRWVWTLMRTDESFPKPISIGVNGPSTRSARWIDEELDMWLTTRQQAKERA